MAKDPLVEYKEDKIEILERDFLIRLDEFEKEHLNSLESEYAVDRYARTLIMSKL